MHPSFTHRLCLLLAMLHLGYQEPAQAASGPKLEVYLDGQTQPEPPSKGEVIAWGSNGSGKTYVPVAAQSGVVAIAAGWEHTVALKHDGSVVAWGSNEWGQNRWGQTIVPVAAQSGVKAIAAGAEHTVALKQDGMVLAWGRNNDRPDERVPVAALTGIKAIAAGDYHTVALTQDGRVLAWGTNGSFQNSVPIVAQSGVVAIAAGSSHTVALKQDGRVLAWGSNLSGQTNGHVAAQSGVVAIAAGSTHTLALKQDRGVIGFGRGLSVVPMTARSTVVALAGGERFSLALKQDGSVLAWGENDFKQTVVPTAAQSGIVAIAARRWNAVALSCPSTQYFSELAVGQFSERTITLRNTGDADLSNLTFTLTGHDGPDFSLADAPQQGTLFADNAIELKIRFTPSRVGHQTAFLSVRSNDPRLDPTLIRLVGTSDGSGIAISDSLGSALNAGEKGRVLEYPFPYRYPSTYLYPPPPPSTSYSQIRVPVDLQSDLVAIAAGEYHTAVLTQDGNVLTWGHNDYGQTSVPVEAKSGVVAIAAGQRHTVALSQEGTVVAWGNNEYGESNVPTAAKSGVAAITAGHSFTVALKQNGRVLYWGGKPYNARLKVPKAARSGVVAVAAGTAHIVALKQDGSVIAWGLNTSGQTSVPVAARSGVVAIAAGSFHTVALKQDGSILVWGYSFTGQTSVPVAANTGVVAIAASGHSTAALLQDGRMIGWGGDYSSPSGRSSGDLAFLMATAAGTVSIPKGKGNTKALVGATGDFGHRQLGTVRDHPIQVSSTGTHPLTIHNITLEGPGAEQFQILGTLPNPMASLSTSPLTLRFAPNRVGLAQATLRISSDDPLTPEYTLLLQGTGISTLTATRPNVADSAFIYAPLRTDPQTGLMLQTITYTNTTKTQLAGLRLILSKVASRVYVHSSSPGPTPLSYEVIYSNPIAPSETISFDLVYFDPLRRRAHSIQPIIKAEAQLEPEPDSPPVDGKLVPLRLAQATPQGPRLDWASAPRSVYVVEYSDDEGQVWHSAVHRLRSGGSQMFWIDRGQPETKTKPAATPNQPGGRTYRIKKL